MNRLFRPHKEHLGAISTVPKPLDGEGDFEETRDEMDFDGDTMVDIPEMKLEHPEADQRSLHDFFGGEGRAQDHPQPLLRAEHQPQQAQIEEDTAMDLDNPSPQPQHYSVQDVLPGPKYWQRVTEAVRRYHDQIMQEDST